MLILWFDHELFGAWLEHLAKVEEAGAGLVRRLRLHRSRQSPTAPQNRSLQRLEIRLVELPPRLAGESSSLTRSIVATMRHQHSTTAGGAV